MADDPYDLFTRCHRLYVQGMRRAISERLESAFGEDWWNLGVWPALSDNQRESLRVGMEREKRSNLAAYLDSGLFPNVVKRNHAAAFADALPDIDLALGQFRWVAHMRNQWAHVPPEGLASDKVRATVEAMTSLLISLRCREVLEVDKMTNYGPGDLQVTSEASPNAEPGLLGDEEDNELTEAPLELWHELQSYLALDSFVVNAGDGRQNETPVRVRVSNVAPIGEGRPEVYFREVHLSIVSQRGHQSMGLGRLEPGQSAEREFTFDAKELASVVFEVKGDLDPDSFFRVRRTAGLPNDVVAPLLREFTERFAGIQIIQPLTEALAAVRSVGPDITLSDAARVRQDLSHVQSLISEKEASLQDLFRDFHLNKQTKIGAHSHEVWKLLREVSTRIEAVDTAIGSTDPQGAAEAIRSLEQLQLAIRQVEETTRSMGA